MGRRAVWLRAERDVRLGRAHGADMSPRYDAKIKARRTREARPRSTANSDQAGNEHLYRLECGTEETGMYDGGKLLVG